MEENAFVTWASHSEPWIPEELLIQAVSLPLNLDHNRHHPSGGMRRVSCTGARDCRLGGTSIVRPIVRLRRVGTYLSGLYIRYSRKLPDGSQRPCIYFRRVQSSLSSRIEVGEKDSDRDSVSFAGQVLTAL
jgi:hypothetical protein